MSQIFRSSSSLADAASTLPSACLRLGRRRPVAPACTGRWVRSGFGRVVRAAGAAVGACRDEDAALGNDDRIAEGVVAAPIRQTASTRLTRACVVAAGGLEAGWHLLGIQLRRPMPSSGRFPTCRFLPSGTRASSSSPLACSLSNSASGISGSLSRGSGQPKHRLRRSLGRVVQAAPRRRGRSVRCRGPGNSVAVLRPAPARHFDFKDCNASSRCSTVRLLTGSGSAGRVLPSRALLAAFEEREAVGIEELSTVRREASAGRAGCRHRPPGRWSAGGTKHRAAVQGFLRHAGRRFPASWSWSVETA